MESPSTTPPVLIGAREFMQDLERVAARASHRLYVQAMTFEGDAAGEELIRLMQACPAPDRKLCIDSYSKVVVNDTFIPSPRWLTDPGFRQEIRRGSYLVEEARRDGIGVQYTNPAGPLLLRYPFRNHKKVVVCDHTVYIGGINFSEHNFAWHDMMVRLEDAALADMLARDVLENFNGRTTCQRAPWSGGEVFALNRNQDRLWDDLLDHFRKAEHSVTLISPYISWPLLEVLRELPESVKVTIVSPAENNKSLFRKNLMHESARGYFDLLLYKKGMSHLKAALIDDAILIAGSSNFDFASYFFEEEIVLTIHEPEVLASFRERVLTPMMADTERVTSTHPEWGAYAGSARILKLLVHSLKRFSSE